MAQPVPLQNTWQYGMRRDVPRDMMPTGSAWNLVDLLPGHDAALDQRGGWAWASTGMDTVPKAGVFATFSSSAGESAQNLAVDANGGLHNVTAGTSSLIGTARTVLQTPVYHGGTAVSAATPVFTGLVIIPDGTGAQAPAKYDGTTVSTLNGVPPLARYAAVYKDYTALANGLVGTTYFPNRMWFSPPGDPDCATAATAWDTTYSWVDFSLPVKGLSASKNVMLVFHDTQVSRVRGSSPPPDEDMVIDDPLFNVGLLDPMSIAIWKDQILFASFQGVFRTDGVTLDNLAVRGGMSRYWLDMINTYGESLTCAGGVIRDTYVLSLMDNGTFVDGFMIDLTSLSWSRISNVKASSMWSGLRDGNDELYFSSFTETKIGALSGIYGDGLTDGDGTTVTTTWESSFYPLGKPGLKRMKRGYVGCELSGSAAATVEYITSATDTSYTSCGALAPDSSGYTRQLIQMNDQAFGVGFKVSKTGSGMFRISDIGVEAWPLEGSRL